MGEDTGQQNNIDTANPFLQSAAAKSSSVKEIRPENSTGENPVAAVSQEDKSETPAQVEGTTESEVEQPVNVFEQKGPKKAPSLHENVFYKKAAADMGSDPVPAERQVKYTGKDFDSDSKELNLLNNAVVKTVLAIALFTALSLLALVVVGSLRELQTGSLGDIAGAQTVNGLSTESASVLEAYSMQQGVSLSEIELIAKIEKTGNLEVDSQVAHVESGDYLIVHGGEQVIYRPATGKVVAR